MHIPFACVYETGSAQLQLFGISSVTLEYPSFQLFAKAQAPSKARDFVCLLSKRSMQIYLFMSQTESFQIIGFW